MQNYSMKNEFIYFSCIYLIILLPSNSSWASDIIWSEDFNSDEDVGCAHDETSTPVSGNWSTDCATAILTDANDYFKVVNGQFEGRDLDGEAIWTSITIDISAFKNVFFTIDLSHTDVLESSDYIEIYYQIDSDPEQLSISQTGNFSAFTHTQTGLSGSNLTLIIKVNNNANLEKHRFDDILVEGTPVNQLAANSFENTGNTWNYDVFPTAYNTETTGDSLEVNGDEDVWSVVQSFNGEISEAADKEQFWGIQDLDNDDDGSGGGNFYHYLEFDPIDISEYQNVTLSFQFYTLGFDSGDAIEYLVEYDNGSTWGTATALDKNTDNWTTVTINIPDDKDIVRLRLQAEQNGVEDFAGWDDIRLTGEAKSLTHYYTSSSSNLEQTSQWDDGEGGQPTDFSSDNQIFHIYTNGDATIGDNWTITGENSELIVGDSSTSTNFIIPSSYTFDGKVDVTDNATLTIETLNIPEFGVLSENSTVVYSRNTGVNNQEIASAVYGNLTLKNNSPSKAFTDDLTVLGNLSFENVTLSATAATDLYIEGNLSLTGTVNFNTNIQNNLDIITHGEGVQTFTGSSSTGTIEMKSLTLEKSGGSVSIADSPATTLALTNDLTIEYYDMGSFTEMNQVSIGRDLIIIGNVDQSIEAGTYQDIFLETSAEVSLNGDVTISSSLRLTSGYLILGDYDLTLSSGGEILGGSNDSYIITKDDKTSGGFLIRETPNNDEEIAFPIGTVESYTPCYITNAGTANNETFTVRVFNDVFENGTSGNVVEDLENMVKKTWEISPVYETGANVKLRFQWNSTDTGSAFDEDLVYVARYEDSWESINEKQFPTEESDSYTTSATSITSFSKFTVAGESASLPVTWLSFTAKENNGQVQLLWKTGTETNNHGFEIQRSSDGKTYQNIGFVNSKGNANHVQEYAYTDNLIKSEGQYYRLKQIDYDGKFSFSRVINVHRQLSVASLNVYTNSTTNHVELGNISSYTEELFLHLFSMEGKLILKGKGSLKTLEKILNQQLYLISPGVYLLHITGNNEVFTTKFIINN